MTIARLLLMLAATRPVLPNYSLDGKRLTRLPASNKRTLDVATRSSTLFRRTWRAIRLATDLLEHALHSDTSLELERSWIAFASLLFRFHSILGHSSCTFSTRRLNKLALLWLISGNQLRLGYSRIEGCFRNLLFRIEQYREFVQKIISLRRKG